MIVGYAMDNKTYLKYSLLGALGAALMLVGDLCLSVIPAANGDSGLFLREAYFAGRFQPWRFPLLVGTGVCGMALCSFAVKISCEQILPQYRKTRMLMRVCGTIYLTSAMAIHLLIGALADWTSTLGTILGCEQTAVLITEQYSRVAPALALPYIGMIGMILISAFAVLSKKTILPRKIFFTHVIVWQLVLMLIPDIRQMLGAEISSWDFVLSQCSGNAALTIWMLANAIWALSHMKNKRRIKA